MSPISNDPAPASNAGQPRPKRTGDAIANTATEAHEQERDRSAPVPEEETYEREPRYQRQR
jgi:hypothetical protein